MLHILFKSQQICSHETITPDIEGGYCPDCGEYVENHWFITRCTCCGIKHKAVVIKGQVYADTKYCKNCGNNKFSVYRLSKINFVDVNYAALIKEVIKNKQPFFSQFWVEPNIFEARKLITDNYKNSH